MFKDDVNKLQELIKKSIKADQQIFQRNFKRQGKATLWHKKKEFTQKKKLQNS